MKKGLVWIIVIAVLVILGFFLFGGGDSDTNSTSSVESGSSGSSPVTEDPVEETIEESFVSEDEEVDVGSLV